jgi:hypothetical protein
VFDWPLLNIMETHSHIGVKMFGATLPQGLIVTTHTFGSVALFKDWIVYGP